jgi:uncharacterized Zn finger protein
MKKGTATMIELKNSTQLSKAIERAKAADLFVQATDRFRQYTVTNRATGAQYNVQFLVSSGHRFATCTCQAGLHGQACKHVVAAAALHLYIAAQAQRAAAPQPARAVVESVLTARTPQVSTFRGSRR